MVFGASERGSRSLAVFWQNLRSDSSQLVYEIELKEFMECLWEGKQKIPNISKIFQIFISSNECHVPDDVTW